MRQIVNFNDPQLVENDPDNELVPMELNIPPFLEEPQQSIDQLEQTLQAEQQAPPAMSDLQQRLARYQDLKNKINEDAFNKRNNDQTMALLLKASQQIGQGAANRFAPNYKADTSIADTLYKQADQNITDISAKQKLTNDQFDLDNNAELNDLKSPMSGILKQKFLERYPKTDPQKLDQLNGAQILKLLPELRNQTMLDLRARRLSQFKTTNIEGPDGKVYKALVNPDTGEIVNTGNIAGFAPSVVKDSYTGENKLVSKGTGTTKTVDSSASSAPAVPGQEVKQSPFEQFNPKMRENFNKVHRAEFEKDIKDDEQAMGKIQSIKDLGQQIINGNGNLSAFASQLGSFYQKGVLSDQDVVRYIQRYDVGGKLQDSFNKVMTGQLSPETVQNILGALTAVENSRNQFINNQAKEQAQKFYSDYKSDLDSKNIGVDDIAVSLHPEFKKSSNDPKIEEYAKAHNLSYEKAMSILKARGYNGK